MESRGSPNGHGDDGMDGVVNPREHEDDGLDRWVDPSGVDIQRLVNT